MIPVSRYSLLLAVLVVSCGPPASDDDAAPLEPRDLRVSEQQARVTSQQAQLAMSLVESTKDYLPFGYTPDGCYARALYMSMELAARKIPSSAQYIEGVLQPSAWVSWRYHVAPMIEITGSNVRSILDPALAPQGPVSLTEWVRLNHPSGAYDLSWAHGSDYEAVWGARNAQQTPVIESFAVMQSFDTEAIAHACATAYSYLRGEGNSAQVVATRRQQLLRRTRTLVGKLQAVGKLQSSPGAPPLRCGFMQFPACAVAATACSKSLDCCSMRCEQGSCRDRPVDLLPDP